MEVGQKGDKAKRGQKGAKRGHSTFQSIQCFRQAKTPADEKSRMSPFLLSFSFPFLSRVNGGNHMLCLSAEKVADAAAWGAFKGIVVALLIAASALVAALIMVKVGRRRERRMRGMPRPSEPFKCPYCRLIIPPTAERCDCGHTFHWADSPKQVAKRESP